MSSDTIIQAYFIVPYAKNPFFVGRSNLLDRIFKTLLDTRPHEYNHRVALYGLGGVGKTQTALEYVHTKKEYYNSIFWISGVNQATLLTGFQQIATETKCITITNESKPFETAKQVLSWLQKQTNWLLVIDNLDDISVITGFIPVIECKGHTLITTRNPNSKGIPAQGVEVDNLDA